MKTPHPWRRLRLLPEWHVEFADLGGTRHGSLDLDRKLIYIDRGLSQVEKRVTICHELHHVKRGDDGPCSPKIEWKIDQDVARWLIPLPQLARALQWTGVLSELADEAWVTRWLMITRLKTMTDAEWCQVEQLTGATG